MDEAFLKGLLAFSAVVLAGYCFIGFPSKKKKLASADDTSDKIKRPTWILILDSWTIRLISLGIAIGLWISINAGYIKLGFIIGFILIPVTVLGTVGAVIDYVKRRKSKSV